MYLLWEGFGKPFWGLRGLPMCKGLGIVDYRKLGTMFQNPVEATADEIKAVRIFNIILIQLIATFPCFITTIAPSTLAF
jgi:hypothetical protein